MIPSILFYTHYTFILLFGILLSFAFAGIRFTKKNIVLFTTLFVLCGLLQIAAYVTYGEIIVWKIYPLITHLPIILLLCLYYRKRILTAFVAVCSAYLFCQIPNWLGLLVESLTSNDSLSQITRIITMLAVGLIVVFQLAHYLSDIFHKDNRSVFIFGILPMVYYVFDYSMGIYTDFWLKNNRVTTEFLPFFLCIVYIIFCVIYYKEQEQKADIARKEQIVRITVEQQQKEMQAIKRSEQEIRILRHDMRHFLETLAFRLDDNDIDSAKKMISNLISTVEVTTIHRYCSNNTVNYILSNFASKCKELQIAFDTSVELAELKTDEIMLSSILSNALENAFNATKDLPIKKRSIKLMLKTSNGKLLLSVKNTYHEKPILIDGVPISHRAGHGYGTQSILYMTERLGGNCQFSVQNDIFILRVVI